MIRLIVAFAMCFVYGCDPPGDDRLWLHNRSADTLYYVKTYTDDLPTTAPFGSHSYLLPDEKFNMKLGTSRWHQQIKATSLGRSLTIYTFTKRIVNRNSWAVIKQNKLYVRSKFTIDQIEKLNWMLPLPKK